MYKYSYTYKHQLVYIYLYMYYLSQQYLYIDIYIYITCFVSYYDYHIILWNIMLYYYLMWLSPHDFVPLPARNRANDLWCGVLCRGSTRPARHRSNGRYRTASPRRVALHDDIVCAARRRGSLVQPSWCLEAQKHCQILGLQHFQNFQKIQNMNYGIYRNNKTKHVHNCLFFEVVQHLPKTKGILALLV